MPRDSTLYVRQAVIRTLKRNVALRQLVPAERVYPQQRPANVLWPFIGYGAPVTGPFAASCLDGSSISVAIHAFAATDGGLLVGQTHSDGTAFDDDATYETDATESGEDQAARIAAAIAAALGDEDGAQLDLQLLAECPYPAVAHVTWVRSQVLQSGSDAAAFHGIVQFDITVIS